jgi:hypothetical protein
MPSDRRFGVPTTYRGVRMRSRLEARWAAMFDSLGWKWSYEPIDLDGYLPDFLVHFERGDVLFEVKGPNEEHEAAKFKIECSGWKGEAIVAGSDIEASRFGQIADIDERLPGFEWGTCQAFFCISCGKPSLLNEDDSWHCRRCGEREGHVGELDLAQPWREAGNRVQWRAA